MTELWGVTCHMGSHNVTSPANVTQANNTPRLNSSH